MLQHCNWNVDKKIIDFLFCFAISLLVYEFPSNIAWEISFVFIIPHGPRFQNVNKSWKACEIFAQSFRWCARCALIPNNQLHTISIKSLSIGNIEFEFKFWF